jgi:tetratricopeptide (TPR) repeat protein
MNHYQRLQVDRKALPEVVKSAYRVLLKEIGGHPDLGGDEEVAKAINEAYEIIGDPRLREQYDRELALADRVLRPPPPPEYIVFCQFCGKRNRVRDEAQIAKARCGACHRKMQPTQPLSGGQDHERSFRLGMFLYEKGLMDRALREMQTAVRLKPASATYRYWLGRCYYQRRTLDRALVEFRVATSLRPRSFQFHFWLGQTYYLMKDYAGAASAFRTASDIRPEHVATRHRLGSALYELQDYEPAAKEFEKVLEIDPHNVQSQRWLGLCLYAHGDPDRAAQAFHEADRMAPGDPFTEKYLMLLGQKSA